MEKKGLMLMLFLIIILIIAIAGYFIFTKVNQEFKTLTGKAVSESENKLIAHYKFENNVKDSAGGNNGLNHGASFSDGKVNNALIVDGIDDRVTVAGIDSQMFNDTTSFTLALWYMPASNEFSELDGSQAFIFGGSGENTGLWVNKVGESVKLGHSYFIKKDKNYLDITDSKKVELNTWNHVTSTYNKDSKETCLYLNGVLIRCKKLSDYGKMTIIREHGLFYIGGRAHGFSLPAKLDEGKIWNYALSEQEIKEEYESYGEKIKGTAVIEKPSDEDEIDKDKETEKTEDKTSEKQEKSFWQKLIDFFKKLFENE